MGKRTDNRQPSPEPVTYPLTRSFSHASYGIDHAPSSHIAPYVPVTYGAPNTTKVSVRLPITGPRFSFSIPRFACSSSRFQISSPRFPISSSRFPISSPRFPISSPRFPISSPRFPISSPRFSISPSSKRLCHRRYRFHSATSGYHSWILFSEILIVTT